MKWIDGRLPARVQRLIEKAQNWVSIVTLWEIAIHKVLAPKLHISTEAICELDAHVLQLDRSHIEQVARLPFKEDHKDPFDRMLIAQAMVEKLIIVSADERFLEYPGVLVEWD